MTRTPSALLLDLVEWVALRPRPYREVMEAWCTSCPQLTVWEDARDAGYVLREWRKGKGESVTVTARGREFLREHGRTPVTGSQAVASNQSERAPQR